MQFIYFKRTVRYVSRNNDSVNFASSAESERMMLIMWIYTCLCIRPGQEYDTFEILTLLCVFLWSWSIAEIMTLAVLVVICIICNILHTCHAGSSTYSANNKDQTGGTGAIVVGQRWRNCVKFFTFRTVCQLHNTRSSHSPTPIPTHETLL